MGACDVMGAGLTFAALFALYSLGPCTLIGLVMASKHYAQGNTHLGNQWAVSAVPVIGPALAVGMI
jgi:hypothetical protein